MAHTHHYKNIKINKLPHSEIEIEGEIEAEELSRRREEAIKKLGANAQIEGFRKGHVPESILVSRLGEGAILEEAAELALGHEYQHIIIDHKIDAISRPEIVITKLALGNPIGFKIKVTTFPEFSLPKYTLLAAEAMKKLADEKVEVSEKEVNETIEKIQRSVAEMNARKEKREIKKDDPLPELTPEILKSFGDFESIDALKERVKKDLKEDKEQRLREKKRLAVSDALINATTIDTPKILVENELDRMMSQTRSDIERMGLSFADYLKHSKKTETDLRTEWTKDAEKRANLHLILNKIIAQEKLFADKKKVEEEVSHLKEHYKDADPERLEAFVEMTLANENVFSFLESQK
jgi:FKBP-type peptidyl-prolyl cis-trans isomerase (trigger factor)